VLAEVRLGQACQKFQRKYWLIYRLTKPNPKGFNLTPTPISNGKESAIRIFFGIWEDVGGKTAFRKNSLRTHKGTTQR